MITRNRYTIKVSIKHFCKEKLLTVDREVEEGRLVTILSSLLESGSLISSNEHSEYMSRDRCSELCEKRSILQSAMRLHLQFELNIIVR